MYFNIKLELTSSDISKLWGLDSMSIRSETPDSSLKHAVVQSSFDRVHHQCHQFKCNDKSCRIILDEMYINHT